MEMRHMGSRVIVPRYCDDELDEAIIRLADLLRERGFEYVTSIYIEPDVLKYRLFIDWVK